MTLRPTQPINLTWDKVSGSTAYDILKNGAKVATAGARSTTTRIVLATGDDVKIVAQPSGQVQDLVINWSTPTPPPPGGFANGSAVVRLGSDYTDTEDLSSLDVITVSYFTETLSVSAKYPKAKVYVYCSMASIDQGGSSMALPWATANANGWLLKDSAGNLLVNKGYTYNNILDITNPAASNALADALVQWCKDGKFYSSWIDDVDLNMLTLLNANPANMHGGNTQAAWEAGIYAHLKIVQDKLTAAGFGRAPSNVYAFFSGDSRSDDGTFMTAFITNLLQKSGVDITIESWVQYPNGSSGNAPDNNQWYGYWTPKRAYHTLCGQYGATFFPECIDQPGALYTRATSLLDDSPCYTMSRLPIPATYATMKVGAPLGPATQNGKIWTRQFKDSAGKTWTARVDTNDPASATIS
jgi:hypothetical protein